MTNITLSVPPDIYARMKIHKEIRWSEVARRAIADFFGKLEERGSETMTGNLFEELGSDFKKKP